MCLPADVIEILQADCIDERLLAVVADSVEKFVRAACYFAEPNKVHTTIQTEKAINVEEDCFRADHPSGASM